MSARKKVVENLAACFRRQDWAGMLPMLTDDIERWEVGAPKASHGKQEFENGIRAGPEVARLTNEITRMVEEGDVVVSEGKVQVHKKDGSVVNVLYCDVWEFEGQRVKRLTAYTGVV